MMGYRARLEQITTAAVAAGITPSTTGLAACTGLPYKTIAKIKRGETVARRTAAWFAAELGTDPEHLFDEVKVR